MKKLKVSGMNKQENLIFDLYTITDSLEDFSKNNKKVKISDLIEYMANKKKLLVDLKKRKQFEESIMNKLPLLVSAAAIYFPEEGFVRRLR